MPVTYQNGCPSTFPPQEMASVDKPHTDIWIVTCSRNLLGFTVNALHAQLLVLGCVSAWETVNQNWSLTFIVPLNIEIQLSFSLCCKLRNGVGQVNEYTGGLILSNHRYVNNQRFISNQHLLWSIVF